jgi:hypothetical protein
MDVLAVGNSACFGTEPIYRIMHIACKHHDLFQIRMLEVPVLLSHEWCQIIALFMSRKGKSALSTIDRILGVCPPFIPDKTRFTCFRRSPLGSLRAYPEYIIQSILQDLQEGRVYRSPHPGPRFPFMPGGPVMIANCALLVCCDTNPTHRKRRYRRVPSQVKLTRG